MTEAALTLLRSWIQRQAEPSAWDWFTTQVAKLEADPADASFDITFGMIPRKLGKPDLDVSEDDLQQAAQCRHNWNPSRWSLDVAARVYVLAIVSKAGADAFRERFDMLHRTGDLAEIMGLFCGLPLYENADALIDTVIRGLRTNVKAEFETIAHRNPYPMEVFGENPWNNMVLKALFIGVMLDPIVGLDERANPELARILSDYAHERWAAGRPVSPELWRCIGPFADDKLLTDFRKVAEEGNQTERKAIALALATAPDIPAKRAIKAKLTEWDAAIASGDLNWHAIAEEMLDNSLAYTRKLNTEVELTR